MMKVLNVELPHKDCPDLAFFPAGSGLDVDRPAESDEGPENDRELGL